VSWQLGAFAILTVALAGGFAWYERVHPDARIVALVGTLAAFAALGRIAFAAFPNVKPTTDIVLISGYALGGGPGFAVGALAGLASNFFFGQGPWTPWQMAGWGAAGVFGAGLAVVTHRRIGRWPLAIVCAVVGFGFTALQDVGDWVTYSDHSLVQLGVYVGKGIGFDFVHAAGCVVFALAFGPALIHSLTRFRTRLNVRWGTATPLLAIALVAVALVARPGLVGVGRAAAASTPAGYLLAAQNADGGIGPVPGSASSALYSGWAALGLAAAGENPQDVVRDGHSLIGYIERGVASASDPGDVERNILVADGAGLPATSFGGRDLVAELQADIGRNGSVNNQTNWTSFAVLALRAAGVAPPPATSAWLVRQQDADGGFNFATRGGLSDVDDTGSALEALAGVSGSAAARDRARAIRYLRRQQDRDGGFPGDPGAGSNAQSTAFAVQGLLAVGVNPSSIHRGEGPSPLDYLRSLIATDGHVRYSRGNDETPTWVTGEALMALEGKPLPVATPARRSAPTLAPHRTPHTTARPAVKPAQARRVAHHSAPRRQPQRARAVTPPPAASAADRLAVDAGILTALSLAFVGGS
jgi:Prenyltransferase and squalene oxidase repeat